MTLLSYEQCAHYHTKAADIAFTNGDVDKAKAHLRAAHYAATGIRHDYLQCLFKSGIERYDELWTTQKQLEVR